MTGREGPLPFSGALRGMHRASESGLCWAGTTGDADPVSAWSRARDLDDHLHSTSLAGTDPRQILAVTWSHLASHGQAFPTLSLLLVAWTPVGFAVSGTGLAAVFAAHPHTPTVPWVTGRHPLLGASGIPAERPGALTIDTLPPWLVSVPCPSAIDLSGLSLHDILPRCGVHR